jgi:hypothetical protein
MTRSKYSLGAKSLLAASVAVVAAGVAGLASAQIGPGSESYRYFYSQPIDKAPSAWRQSHPNGMTEEEVQSVASSDLSAFAAKVNPPVFTSVPADPTWRQTQRNGLTGQVAGVGFKLSLEVAKSGRVGSLCSDLLGGESPKHERKQPSMMRYLRNPSPPAITAPRVALQRHRSRGLTPAAPRTGRVSASRFRITAGCGCVTLSPAAGNEGVDRWLQRRLRMRYPNGSGRGRQW